jgi:hypothetical protein
MKNAEHSGEEMFDFWNYASHLVFPEPELRILKLKFYRTLASTPAKLVNAISAS